MVCIVCSTVDQHTRKTEGEREKGIMRDRNKTFFSGYQLNYKLSTLFFLKPVISFLYFSGLLSVHTPIRNFLSSCMLSILPTPSTKTSKRERERREERTWERERQQERNGMRRKRRHVECKQSNEFLWSPAERSCTGVENIFTWGIVTEIFSNCKQSSFMFYL